MDDNFRKLNIHFDPAALREAYDTAVNDIGFSGELVNCISLTHPEGEQDETRGIFWTHDADYNEIQVEKHVD